jgi:D-arabinose 1-dehydrogenase-like Zn-dependent alcohol dehydrogenase
MVPARAAVLRQTGTPMTIETVEVGPVADGDVLVRIRAASLCHTDLEAIAGTLAVKLPAVLGHEAAGEIVELGAGVTGSRSAIASCCRGTRIAGAASIASGRSRSCVCSSSPMGRSRTTSMAGRGSPATARRCTS